MLRRRRANAEEAGWSMSMKAEDLNAEKTKSQRRRGRLVNANEDELVDINEDR